MALNILLIGKDQQESILHFAIVDNLVKLGASLLQTSSVAGVHNEDQTLCTRIVVSPEGSDLVLSTNIPDIELHILIGDAFNVETDGRDSGDVLIGELQFVEDCGLSSSIQTQHQNPHLLRTKNLPHNLGNLTTHCD